MPAVPGPAPLPSSSTSWVAASQPSWTSGGGRVQCFIYSYGTALML